MTKVPAHAFQDHGRHLDLAHDRVAASAQESANASSVMAVVNDQHALGRLAEQARAPLALAQRFDLLRRQAVLALQASPLVLRSGKVRVRRSPPSQPLVSPRPVLGSVAARAFVRARSAVRAEVSARASKRGQRQVLFAVDASLGVHGFSMAYRCDMSAGNQSCHADVLLGIANAPVEDGEAA